MPRRMIISQMFDVRPVDRAGNLDWNKIKEVEYSASSNRDKKVTSFSTKEIYPAEDGHREINGNYSRQKQASSPVNKGQFTKETWSRAELKDNTFHSSNELGSESDN